MGGCPPKPLARRAPRATSWLGPPLPRRLTPPHASCSYHSLVSGPPWKYEPDESPYPKHKGKSSKPQFVKKGDEIVSLCPNTISRAQAEAALNSGFPFSTARDNSDHPSRIYAVINGVVYRATPSNPGVSYHGFPELAEKFRPYYGRLKHEIMKLAVQDGSEEEVEKWLKQFRRA